MFYVDGWVPLVDVVTRVEAAIAKRYRASGQIEAIGSDDFDREVYRCTWTVCDTCHSGVLTTTGHVISLSKRLFTRQANGSPFGDFLCLTVGQLGIIDIPVAADFREPWDNAAEFDPIDLVKPYLHHHVLILDDDVFSGLLSDFSHPQKTATGQRGRPQVTGEFLSCYRKKFPNGHAGHTKAEVISAVAEAGGPHVSLSTFDRALK